jgi:RNA polymerase sigma-B factor
MPAEPGTAGSDREASPQPDARRHSPAPNTPERERLRELFRRYAAKHEPDVREQLVNAHLNLVHYLANRFSNRGEPIEDLVQVGSIGLLKAIERFDPSRGNEFTTFATPTIVGEIRRHFRDKGWAIRVPRRLQELQAAVAKTDQQLSQELQRAASVEELARRMGVSEDEVLEAMELAPVQHMISLDASTEPESDGHAQRAPLVAEGLGLEDPNLERAELREAIERAMAHLTEREKKIMYLRFYEQLSQAEIAKQMGISQMHVSRLQRAALEQLRRYVPEATLEKV